MSEFLHHEGCPSCGSKDNVGVYDDGHKFCFGCGWGISGYKGVSVKDLAAQLKQKDKNKNELGADPLPSDFTYGLPVAALTWLRKYGVTDEEIHRERMGWSDDRQLLVFPFFGGNGDLLFWQGRYFGTNADYPRYRTSGSPEEVFVFVDEKGRSDGGNDRVFSSRCVVVVEDFVSAIRVGRNFTTVSLFGSQLSIDRLRKLSDRFTNLVIWLDRDKLKYAVKTRYKALPYFDRVSVVVRDLDPKEYSDEDIRAIVKRSQEEDRGFSR